jgi:hypothetical protein
VEQGPRRTAGVPRAALAGYLIPRRGGRYGGAAGPAGQPGKLVPGGPVRRRVAVFGPGGGDRGVGAAITVLHVGPGLRWKSAIRLSDQDMSAMEHLVATCHSGSLPVGAGYPHGESRVRGVQLAARPLPWHRLSRLDLAPPTKGRHVCTRSSPGARSTTLNRQGSS